MRKTRTSVTLTIDDLNRIGACDRARWHMAALLPATLHVDPDKNMKLAIAVTEVRDVEDYYTVTDGWLAWLVWRVSRTYEGPTMATKREDELFALVNSGFVDDNGAPLDREYQTAQVLAWIADIVINPVTQEVDRG
jgi:Rieske Fe-S protein